MEEESDVKLKPIFFGQTPRGQNRGRGVKSRGNRSMFAPSPFAKNALPSKSPLTHTNVMYGNVVGNRFSPYSPPYGYQTPIKEQHPENVLSMEDVDDEEHEEESDMVYQARVNQKQGTFAKPTQVTNLSTNSGAFPLGTHTSRVHSIYTPNHELSLQSVADNYLQVASSEALAESIRSLSDRSSNSFRPFDVTPFIALREEEPSAEGWRKLIDLCTALAVMTSRELSRASAVNNDAKKKRLNDRPGAAEIVTYTPSFPQDDRFKAKYMVIVKTFDGTEKEINVVHLMLNLGINVIGVTLYEALSRVILAALTKSFGEERRHYSGYSSQKNKDLTPIASEWITSVVDLSFLAFKLNESIPEEDIDLVKVNMIHAGRQIIANSCDKARQKYKKENKE